jgi:hypothetical protein
MSALMERYEVSRFMRGEWQVDGGGNPARTLQALTIRGIETIVPHSGDRLHLARGIWIDVLGGRDPAVSGDTPGPSAMPEHENNRSLVLRLELDGLSVLLPGDLEITGEHRLNRFSAFLPSDILKVAHHGSGGATSDTFLGLVQPSLAVISCGRNNRHGHPDPRVLEALRSGDVEIWRTDRAGALVLHPRH